MKSEAGIKSGILYVSGIKSNDGGYPTIQVLVVFAYICLFQDQMFLYFCGSFIVSVFNTLISCYGIFFNVKNNYGEKWKCYL